MVVPVMGMMMVMVAVGGVGHWAGSECRDL